MAACAGAHHDGGMSPEVPSGNASGHEYGNQLGHLFTAIDHVGIAVPDLDEAIAFYRDVFGMQTVHEETNAEQGVREAMVAVGDPERPHSCIQLLAPLSPDSTIAKFLERSGPGMQQLAYRVDDVDAVAETLRARGLRLLYDEPRPGTSGSRVNFVHPKDAGGVLIELVELRPVTR
jgi:methylmalonyl-CoA/ethylmalonyl-CoA epimerase